MNMPDSKAFLDDYGSECCSLIPLKMLAPLSVPYRGSCFKLACLKLTVDQHVAERKGEAVP